MPNVILLLLGLLSLPSVFGLLYLWSIYLESPRRPWLLRMLSITSTIVTVVLVYVSWAVFNRLIGGDPLPSIFSVLATIALAFIVPYKALSIYFAMHGGEPPAVPKVRDDDAR